MKLAVFMSICGVILIQALTSAKKRQTCMTSGCYCITPTVLDCSTRSLTNFDIKQVEVKEIEKFEVLKLNNNKLQHVPDISNFSGIHTLDLSYNNISSIPSGVFSSLKRLLHLNISFNNLILSDSTISAESFHGLSNLKSLRMKQNRRPSEGFNYSALSPLNGTLEELFITGTPTFTTSFGSFSLLHTLSLGGSECHLPSLNYTNQTSLSNLPLSRLSARNCKVREIDRYFLQSFRLTLKKLDLSCNHLMSFLREISLGVEFSQLNTLIIDNINREGGLTTCPWVDASNSVIEPLSNTPLRILSLQANQIGSQTKINLRDTCTDLIYLDVSQNDFNKTAFYIARTVQGQPVPDADAALFHNKALQLPSLRFIGFQALTTVYRCGDYDPRILNCDEDSYLFLEDEYYWDHNYDPDIMDFILLLDIIKNSPRQLYGCYINDCPTETIVNIVTQAVDDMGVTYASHRAINKTIYYLIQEAGSLRNIPSYVSGLRYIYVNVTHIALGYNNFVSSDNHEKENPICSNINLYPNNVDTLNFSYSSDFGFGSCASMKGFTYLTNITCRDCGMIGWNPDLFLDLPLKYLDVRQNKLGQFLRNDIEAKALSSAPHLEKLLLGEQVQQRIQYFSNTKILSNHPQLTHLDLHQNQLVSWNISIANNSMLAFIDLRHNKISYIEEHFRDELDNQYRRNSLAVYIAGNDAQCSNSSLDYIFWLINSTSVADAEEVKCSQSDMTVEAYYNYILQPTTTADTVIKLDNGTIATIVLTSTVTFVVLILLVIGWLYRYTIVYKWYQRKSAYAVDEEGQGETKIEVFASYPHNFTDNIISLQIELRENQHAIKLKSRELDILPGPMIRASIAKLIAQSDKIIIFLTPDYLKDETSKFEFELIKQRGVDRVVLVTFGIDSAKQLGHVPTVLKDIISNERHILWPTGLCAGGVTNTQAFVQMLLSRVRE